MSGRQGGFPRSRQCELRFQSGAYVLRSYVFCAGCGRRMFGKTRRDTAYYACQPPSGSRPEGHPASGWVREDRLLDRLSEFFVERVFGRHRRAYLKQALSRAQQDNAREHQARVDAAHRALKELETRRTRLVRQLEHTDDPDGELIRDITARAAELASQRDAKRAELTELENTAAERSEPGLLDTLPTGTPDLTAAPLRATTAAPV